MSIAPPPTQRRSKLPPPLRHLDSPPASSPPFARAMGPVGDPTLLLPTPPDSNPHPLSSRPRSLRNLKKLSLAIPGSAAQTANNSPQATATTTTFSTPVTANPIPNDNLLSIQPSYSLRRPSVVSLPGATTTAAAAFARKDEQDNDLSPTIPYADGPIQLMNNVWIGTDDNARDWKALKERGIKYILNVAKELPCPFEAATGPLRSTYSTSALSNKSRNQDYTPTYYHAHLPTGRPAFHYLKLPWSHGQTDLVKQGFPDAMSFVDEAMERNQGVLIHCQCGVSRSATLVIALVMRAAALSNETSPPEITALKGGGMHAAYSFVKDKSRWIGPNMSLIYQLLDYERTLNSGLASPSSSIRSSQPNEEELDWGRQRQAMEENALNHIDSAPDQPVDNSLFAHEAKALDLEMEERNVARKASESSISLISDASANNYASGTGPIWKSRYGFSSIGLQAPGFNGRTRTGSTSSNFTTRSSTLSENLLEEDEGEFMTLLSDSSRLSPSTSATEDDVHAWNVPEPSSKEAQQHPGFQQSQRPGRATATLSIPLTAPPTKSSFPHHQIRLSTRTKNKHRPSPLVGILPPVPSSPIPATAPIHDSTTLSVQQRPPNETGVASHEANLNTPITALSAPSSLKEPRKQAPPVLHLRCRKVGSFSSTTSSIASQASTSSCMLTPSQTLFVFPPSPTSMPTTMMLTATPSSHMPFPVIPTPRVSTMRVGKHGRTRSYIGLGAPPTPTTAFSHVEVQGTIDARRSHSALMRS